MLPVGMMKILVCTTDPEFAEVCRQSFPSGLQCVGWEQMPAVEAKFDLILLDISNQPAAWRQTCQQVRRTSHGLLWLVAQQATEALLDLAVNLGVDDLLVKPVSPAYLQLRLAAWERRRVTTAEEVPSLDGDFESLLGSEWEGEWNLAKATELIERFLLAARGSTDGWWHAQMDYRNGFDTENTKMWWSSRFKELLGFDEEDEFPDTVDAWASRLHPADHDWVLAAVQRSIEEETPYDVQYQLRLKSGEYRWFQAKGAAVWNRSRTVVRIAGSLRDIHEQRAAEASLQESEERYRVLVEVAPAPILVHRNENLLYVNPAAVHLLGTNHRDQLLGRSLQDFFTDDAAEIIAKCLQQPRQPDQPIPPIETQLRRPDGTILSVEVIAAPLNYAGEDAILTIALDTTEKKKAIETAWQEQQFLRRLLDSHERDRRLIAYEIHDGLVQYLTGAIMRLEALTENLDIQDEEMAAQLELALFLSRNALKEGRRLLSGMRPPILDESGIVAALDYLRNEFAGQHNVEIVLEHQVQIDRLAPMLESVLFRIAQEALNNACRHSRASRIKIVLTQREEGLLLEVFDNGTGFDPTQTSDERFGLQGIRERARLLGGKATIQSSPGAGTRVAVSLPVITTKL